MREEVQPWHSIVLQCHQSNMADTLIFPHNITTEVIKSYTLEDEQEQEYEKPFRGHFAIKEINGVKKKYLIEESNIEHLPIRINQTEEMYFKDSARTKTIIHRPTNITPFKINPERKWESNHEFINNIAPFKHSHPDQWTLNKIIAIMGLIGKTFCCVCSKSEFGKSSIYLILDAITQKSPVFQPRSVPGVLAQITMTGNMVFDEVHDAPTEVKNCMENFSLQVAGNSPVYINGAMRAKNTKSKYDVSQQSITYLYNVYSNYSSPEKQFWDYIWANTKAMESRFLRLTLTGKLEEQFDKDFNITKVAEENKMLYINIAKHLLYLKELKQNNQHVLRYTNNNLLNLKGRHKIIYQELTWGLDVYCSNQEEYDKFINLLNQSITIYAMQGNYCQAKITEEAVI